MIRTITSHTSRRHRVRRRIHASSSVSFGRCIKGAPSATASTFQLSMPFCLPCMDDSRSDHFHHHGVQSRKLHSLSTSSCNHHHTNNITSSLQTSILRTSNATTQSTRQPSTIITTPKRTKVFVSRHNNTLNLSPEMIISYVTSHLPHLNPNSINSSTGDFRITNTHVIMKECPFCSKPTNDKI